MSPTRARLAATLSAWSSSERWMLALNFAVPGSRACPRIAATAAGLGVPSPSACSELAEGEVEEGAHQFAATATGGFKCGRYSQAGLRSHGST